MSCRVPELLSSVSATLREHLLRAAADALDHLGRIAGIMFFDDLEYALRVLKRRIGLGPAGHPLQKEIGEGLCLGDRRRRSRHCAGMTRLAFE